MKNKNIIYLGLFLLLAVFAFSFTNKPKQSSLPPQTLNNKNNCLSDDCLAIEDFNYPAGELPQAVIESLNQAIDDEYKAHAVYEAVINKFGSSRPFSMIIRAEEQHISSLKSIYDKYGLLIPVDNWTGKISAPNSLQDACKIGVDAEIANAALYRDKLLPTVKDYSDITTVFQNLMNSSQQKHLIAFQRCQ